RALQQAARPAARPSRPELDAAPARPSTPTPPAAAASARHDVARPSVPRPVSARAITAPIPITAPVPAVPASTAPAVVPAPHSARTAPLGTGHDADFDGIDSLFGVTNSEVEFDALAVAGPSRAEHPAAARRTAADAHLPRPAAAPARIPSAAAARPPRGVRVRRALVRVGMGIGAAVFSVGLVLSSSVPANSLLSRDDIAEMQAAAAVNTTQDVDLDQTVQIASGQIDGVGKEEYTSMTLLEYARAAGIRPAATFTNNPNGTIQWPFKVGVGITSKYGYRSCAGCTSNHHGVDFVPGYGAEIQAIADGVVVYTEESEGSLGVHMIIEHQIEGKTVASVYAHMQYNSMRFNVGDTVHVGDTVGLTGNTGQSTGPHLHFEIRLGGMDGTYTDPLAWLYANTN
ncbi:M23 family metallopeptidase, partial [Agromyces seonyuensis]